MPFGTLDVFSSLAAQAGSQTVATFGEDRVFAAINDGFAIHNRITREMIANFVEFTNDRLRRWGGNATGDMEATDEYGIPDAQKVITGDNLGFPLRYWTYGLQWTRKFFQNNTVRELTAQATSARQAHIRRVQRELLRAMFNPTNNLTYKDALIDLVTLPIRALRNADSTAIPPNPYNGAEFDSATHTHFLFGSAISNALMDALIATVQEHGVIGTLVVEIPQLAESAVRALTNFVPQLQANITLGGGSTVTVATGALDTIDTTNRQIGVYGAAQVWVKPWTQATSSATYWVTCRDSGKRPIGFRTREGVAAVNLVIEYENENFPLRARVASDEFGMAAADREAMAILYIASGASAYVAPVIP